MPRGRNGTSSADTSPAGAPRKPAKKAYKVPDPLPTGEILVDLLQQRWQLGQKIGQGGFGLIYSARSLGTVKAPINPGPRGSDANFEYVIKLENIDSVLFSEVHFYQKAAKDKMVDAFIRERRLHTLGVPRFYGTGPKHQGSNGKFYRFLVMERCGTDLVELLKNENTVIPQATAAVIACQILDVLEYLHSKLYVHADIKSANLMIGFGTKRNQVYLIDYGLVSQYAGVHKPHVLDKRRCHDGTIEYTSRDAHLGAAPSRRGDLEILAHCLLEWYSGGVRGDLLPWSVLAHAGNQEKVSQEKVSQEKQRFWSSLLANMNQWFSSINLPLPDELFRYMEYVSTLDYEKEPDYDRCRRFFQDALRSTYKLPADYSKAELIFTKQRTTTSATSSSSASSAKARSSKQVMQAAAASSASTPRVNDDDEEPATVPKKASATRSRSRTKKAKPSPVPVEPAPLPHANGYSRGHNLANGFTAHDGDSDDQKPAVSRPKKSQQRRGVGRTDDGDSDGGVGALASAASLTNGDDEFKAPIDPVWHPAPVERDSSPDDERRTAKAARTRPARKPRKVRSRPSSQAATPETSESDGEAAAAAAPIVAGLIPAVASSSRSRARKGALTDVADKLKRKSIATVQKGAALRAAARYPSPSHPLSPRSIIPALAGYRRVPALSGARQVMPQGSGAGAVAASGGVGIIPALTGGQRSAN